MPSIIPTLLCQVSGLKAIYSYSESICFEFEDAKQLKRAQKKVSLLCQTKPAFILLSCSKKPTFAFSVSNRTRGTVINISITQLMLDLVNIMATQTRKKNIPIMKCSNHSCS